MVSQLVNFIYGISAGYSEWVSFLVLKFRPIIIGDEAVGAVDVIFLSRAIQNWLKYEELLSVKLGPFPKNSMMERQSLTPFDNFMACSY